jgi:hypothetical protein
LLNHIFPGKITIFHGKVPMFLGGLEPSFAEAMLAWSFAKLGGNGAVDAVMAALAESARQQVEERQAELLGSE